MDFTRRVELDAPYDDAITYVKDALKEQGFGVLTEINVRQTLKDKLDIDVDAQIILGACNPQLAHRALGIDPRAATLLPCNVVVRTDNGHTVVEALDPKIIAEVPGNATLGPIAEQAGQRIQAALDALPSQRPTPDFPHDDSETSGLVLEKASRRRDLRLYRLQPPSLEGGVCPEDAGSPLQR